MALPGSRIHLGTLRPGQKKFSADSTFLLRLYRSVCPAQRRDRSIRVGKASLPLSYRRRILLRNSVPQAPCSLCTPKPLSSQSSCSDTCQLCIPPHTGHTPGTLSWSCTSLGRTWCKFPPRFSRTRRDIYPLDRLHSLRRRLPRLRCSRCDTTGTDTVEQPRMIHTALFQPSSCSGLLHMASSFPLRRRRNQCDFHPEDKLHMTRRLQVKYLRTYFGPGQAGMRSRCTRKLRQFPSTWRLRTAGIHL